MEDIMTNKNSGEQPQTDFTLNAGEQQNFENQIEGGSLMDKFKNVEALKTAYKNLEKQFTQKCQKVKELTEKISGFDNVKESAPKPEQTDTQGLAEFFESCPQAKKYEDEISRAMLDSDVASTKNPLQTALTKVLTSKIVPYDLLVKDEEFLNAHIYNNEQINKKIVDRYLQDISTKKAMPLIAGFSGTGNVTSPVSKPKTITEAGRVAEAYFKN